MNQSEMIYIYNINNRPRFNRELFERDDNDIINALKDVIYSCQRESTFIIRVLEFDVIDNYDDINHILWAYEDSIINKNKNPAEDLQNREKPTTTTGRKQDNQYDFINLKDSDIKMIKIKYYIGINEKKGYADDTMIVYIAIPRIVDNFYFRINGNIYSAMYQIVDASTYNNNNSKNAKKLSVTLKTIFMPIRVYKYINTLRDVNDNELNCTYFVGNMFKKSLLLMKYIFAKMGYYNALNFLKVPGVIISEDYKDINPVRMKCIHFLLEQIYLYLYQNIFIIILL